MLKSYPGKSEIIQERRKKPVVSVDNTLPIKFLRKPRTAEDYEFRRLCLEQIIKSTQQKAAERIGEMGYRSARGNPHSAQSIRRYAHMFITEYPLDARALMHKQTGEFPDTENGDRAWLYFLVNIAIRTYKSRDRFIRWAIKFGIYEKGFYLFKDPFNLREEDINAFKGMDR